MLARVYATAFPSVSVCLSVCRTRGLYQNGKHFVEIILPPDSRIILVFRHRWQLLNSDGFTPNGGVEYMGLRKLGDFWPISRCISETLRDTATVAIQVE